MKANDTRFKRNITEAKSYFKTRLPKENKAYENYLITN